MPGNQHFHGPENHKDDSLIAGLLAEWGDCPGPCSHGQRGTIRLADMGVIAEPAEAGMGQAAADWGRLRHSKPAQLRRVWRNDPPLGTPAPGRPGGFRGALHVDIEHSFM